MRSDNSYAGVARIYEQALMDQQLQQNLNPVPLDQLLPQNTRLNYREDPMMTNTTTQPTINPNIQMRHRQARPTSQYQYQTNQNPLNNTTFPNQGINYQPNNNMREPNQTMIVNPFDILGIPRNTNDESVIKKAYNKWVMILHPDRGGDPRKFQEISRAYQMILEVLQHIKNENFEHMKQQAEHDLSNMQQITGFHSGTKDGNANPSLAPLGNGMNFNSKTFNQVFDQNRMWKPEDDGYDNINFNKNMTLEEMQRMREKDVYQIEVDKSLGSFTGGSKKFEQQFNNVFNERGTLPYQNSNMMINPNNQNNSSMVRRTEPDMIEIFKTPTSLCTTLSVEKIDDFGTTFNSGSSNSGASYCDYKKAFSIDTMITPHTLDAKGNGYTTVEELEKERAQISFIPSQDLLMARSAQEAALKEQDEIRWRNYLNHQEKIEAHNQAIRNLLSDKSSVNIKPTFYNK